MLSINTNLSSLITQNSMKTSTDKLNQAIERMSTGFKINHAKDNAANYSISTNMTTKMSAYQVAEDNATMGLDMIATASENLSLIEDKLSRLRSLAVQAQNGTYGEQSLTAINAEANALAQEIDRIKNNSSYNGVKLLDSSGIDAKSYGCSIAGPNSSGFIEDVEKIDTTNMDKIASITDESVALGSGTYSVSTVEDLEKIRRMGNTGKLNGVTLVLANDIDMSGVDWHDKFISIDSVTFDGNGFKIKGINRSLFSTVENSTIKNFFIEAEVTSNHTAYAGSGFIIDSRNSTIENCSLVGSVTNVGGWYGGGLIAWATDSNVKSCYTNLEPDSFFLGEGGTGSLVGAMENGTIENCISEGGITIDYSGSAGFDTLIVSGLVGASNGTAQIINSKFAGDINININCPDITTIGVTGLAYGVSSIKNSTFEGNINVKADVGLVMAGGLGTSSNISDCTVFADFNIETTGIKAIASLAGVDSTTPYNISNCIYSSKKNIPLILDTSTGTKVTSGISNIYSLEEILARETATLQVGIGNNNSSHIDVNIGLFLKDFSNLLSRGIENKGILDKLDNYLNIVSAKQTEFGAITNRLESVLEEITIQYDNLASSRSTIRDADMAELSSTYIQQQILQQASATLLATANQNPAIALQLI